MAAKPDSPVTPVSPVSNLQDLVTCSVCLEDFTDPRALPCFHSYCKACLERLMTRQGKITCPYCRIEFEIPDGDVSKLSRNFLVNSLLDMVSLTNEVAITSDSPHCNSHAGRECELYCKDCSKLICFQCIVKWGDCHDHSYRDVAETATVLRRNLLDLSEERKQLLPKVEKHLGLLRDMRAREIANIADVCEVIEENVRKHIDNLNIRKYELVTAANMAQSQGEDSLLAELDRVHLEKAKFVNTIELCKNIIEIENPTVFIQKYSEVRERVFESDTPELFSHVEVENVRFEENDTLLRDVVVNYGRIVKRDVLSDEKPPVVGPNHGRREGIAENPGPSQANKRSPNKARKRWKKSENRTPPLATAREENQPPSKNNPEPVLWKLYPKNRGCVAFETTGLSVQSQSTKCSSVTGIPGFMNGKHSWKVRLQNLGTGLGIGVCIDNCTPGLCVVLDSGLTLLANSTTVAVELDCEAKRVRVTPEGHRTNTIVYENPLMSTVHPYFLLFPMDRDRNLKITVIEMDGKSLDGSCECTIL